MENSNTLHHIEIMKAFLEEEPVQFRSKNDNDDQWLDLEPYQRSSSDTGGGFEPFWNFRDCEYRIRPIKKTPCKEPRSLELVNLKLSDKHGASVLEEVVKKLPSDVFFRTHLVGPYLTFQWQAAKDRLVKVTFLVQSITDSSVKDA